MKMTFGQAVQEQRERIGWSIARAADQAGWKWPRWQRIEQDEPKRHDGSPPQLRRETVLKVAQALSWNPEDALNAAGYATTSLTETSEGEGDSLTYDPSDADEDGVVLRFYHGINPILRPKALAILKTLMDEDPDYEEGRVFGRKAE